MTDVRPVSHSRSPLLVVLSGPSGSGKDSVISRLKRMITDMDYVVTVTTRPPRAGETEGVSYFFVSQSGFDEMMDAGDLLAAAKVHGHWYGVPLSRVRSSLSKGTDVFLKVDVQGALAVRRRIPQAVFIFLSPPSIGELIERLAARDTEAAADLDRRICDARSEMEQMRLYDYLVVNGADGLQKAVEDVASVIRAERLRIHRQPISMSSH